jgi:long-chain acyl-CoA synthetase
VRGEQRSCEVADRAKGPRPDDLATIVYTSGTTGKPKGCMLTHGNILWTARQVQVDLDELFTPDDSTVLFLPLAHSFARLIQFGCLELDVKLGYARNTQTIAEDIRSFRPTFLLSVPRVFEKVFNKAQRDATGPKRKIFDGAVSTGQGWSEAESPGPLVSVQHKLFDKLVLSHHGRKSRRSKENMRRAGLAGRGRMGLFCPRMWPTVR